MSRLAQQVLQIIEELGPMTRREICRELGWSDGSVISRMNVAAKNRPKLLFKLRFIDEVEGLRRYPRAVFAIGDMEDAKKPKRPSRRIFDQRYDERVMSLRTTNSVFNLALTKSQLKKAGMFNLKVNKNG